MREVAPRLRKTCWLRSHMSPRESRERSTRSLTPGTLKSYFCPPPKVLRGGAPGIVGARVGGPFALLIRRQTRLSRGVTGTLVTGITVTTLLTSVATASAQNIFEALFGRLWNSHVTSYADPNASSRSPEATMPRESSPIVCAYATDVTSQFNVIAGQLRRRPAAPCVRQAQTRSTTATPSTTRSRQTASATRSLPPRSRTGRRSSPAAPATAGTPSASSTQPLLMIRHCVPATPLQPMLV